MTTDNNDRKSGKRNSKKPLLCLIGVSGLAAGAAALWLSPQEQVVDVQRTRYASREACLQDWNDPADCELVGGAGGASETAAASDPSGTTQGGGAHGSSSGGGHGGGADGAGEAVGNLTQVRTKGLPKRRPTVLRRARPRVRSTARSILRTATRSVLPVAKAATVIPLPRRSLMLAAGMVRTTRAMALFITRTGYVPPGCRFSTAPYHRSQCVRAHYPLARRRLVLRHAVCPLAKAVQSREVAFYQCAADPADMEARVVAMEAVMGPVAVEVET